MTNISSEIGERKGGGNDIASTNVYSGNGNKYIERGVGLFLGPDQRKIHKHIEGEEEGEALFYIFLLPLDGYTVSLLFG